MKAYQIQQMGDLSGLQQVELPKPEVGPGEVLVNIKACSLNFRDHLVLRGLYNPKMPVPRIPLSDCCGEVVETGDGVDQFQVGDRVSGLILAGWQAGPPRAKVFGTGLGGETEGVLAEYVLFKESGVIKVPDHLTAIQAATLPCAALTAWNALMTDHPVKPGETVLLLGTGGVSLFALQFAKIAGASVAITSSSDQKLELARNMGADFTVNYRENDEWEKEILNWTNRAGVDHVVEVGGAGTLPKTAKAVRIGGHIALIGVLSGASDFNPISVLMKAVTLRGIYIGSGHMYEEMNRAISKHKLEPVIDQVFPFEEVPQAYEYLASGKHSGKIVIDLTA